MEQKPGTTRFMFIAVPVILLIFGALAILYAVKADLEGLKEVCLLAIGALSNALGLISGYYFGKKDESSK